MKLCVPTETDRGMDASLSAHFGTSPFFTMVELDDGTTTVIRNPACGHASGQCHHLDILRAHGVEAVACSGIGRRAFEALERAGIRVIQPRSTLVAEIVAKLRNREQVPLTIGHTCSGHHGQGCGHGHRHQHRHRHGRV